MCLLVSTSVSAQELPSPTPPPAPVGSVGTELPPPPPTTAVPPPVATPGMVTYGRIDRATVRVLAVGRVDVSPFRGRRYVRPLAEPESGHGSGVIVDPRGVILTARHVVEDATHVAVRFPHGGGVRPAVVVYQDRTLDFAILLVHADGLRLDYVPVPDVPPALHTRQTVDAVGYPMDPTREEPQSSRGIVAAALPDGTLQLGMALNPGNSGGPVFDEHENLVGLVFAGGRVRAGVQGVALAVPIAPVGVAYRSALANGALAAAQRTLRAEAPVRQLAASIVDELVRLEVRAFVDEATRAPMPFSPTTTIDRIDAIAQATTDPFLQVLAAAWFWNAAMVVLEVNGWGAFQPAQVPEGPVRVFASRTWNRAIDLVASAVRTRPSLVRESPFVGAIAGLFPHVVSGEAPRTVSNGPAPATPYERRGLAWFPVVGIAGGVDFSSVGGEPGFFLDVSLPVWIFGREGETRFAPMLGGWAAMTSFSKPDDLDVVYDDAVQWRGGALLGLALRMGRLAAFHLSVAWAPGRTHEWTCDRSACVGRHERALAAARMTGGFSLGNVTLGAFLHISEPGISMLAGLRLGTTFQ